MRKKQTEQVILCVDTGIDDAVAMLMAVSYPQIQVQLICCGYGNTSAEVTTNNTLKILEFIGKGNIPVAKGVNKGFRKTRKTLHVHGATGLGDYDFEDPTIQAEDNAVESMYQRLVRCKEPLTIISTGPLTNVAILFEQHPDIVSKIKRVVFMGGSDVENDVEDPYLEFNESTDPEAAEYVYTVCEKENIPLHLVPCNMGHTAYLDYYDVYKTKTMNYVGEMLEIVFRSYKDRTVKNGIATHDGCAIAYVLQPKMFETKQGYVKIKYFPKYGTGVSITNFHSKTKNATICTSINTKMFKNLYFNTLKKFN